MNPSLLAYYRQELAALRTLAGEFAEDHPDVAPHLKLGPDAGDDPHVERMISGCAFLTARVRQKLDDDFPEISDALLGVLYPHYLAPIPSMAVVEFVLDRGQGGLADGYPLERDTELETEAVAGEPCRYRTCSAVTLWPIEVTAATLGPMSTAAPVSVPDAVAQLRIRLKCLAKDMTFAKLNLDKTGQPKDHLRFFLSGQDQHVLALYELLFNHTLQVTVETPAAGRPPWELGSDAVCHAGFEDTAAMLPYSPRSFPGYRLLTEYFAFPQKFCFFDLTLPAPTRRQLGNEIELCLYSDRPCPELAPHVAAKTFRLGCTPVVNLFRQHADPIRLRAGETEYRVVPDRRRPPASREVYSIRTVTGIQPDGSRTVCEPFYSLRHAASEQRPQAFWSATRRESSRSLHGVAWGTELYLTLVDLDPGARSWDGSTLDLEIECLNRDLPGNLKFSPGRPLLRVIKGGPLSKVSCLTAPTPTRRPPLGRGTVWRLISHLSLNHLSLADDPDGTEAFREILRLYDHTGSASTRARIAGILRVASRRVIRRVKGETGGGVCQGLLVEIEFDDDHFADNGLFLFATVIERVLGLYSPVNSFTQLSIRSRQCLKTWKPRGANQEML